MGQVVQLRDYNRKFGRHLVRGFDQTVPHWSSMRLMRGIGATPLPLIPDNIDWTRGIPVGPGGYIDLGPMLNAPNSSDPAALVLGDCTNAGAHHARQIWTFQSTGQMVTDPDNCVLQGYEESCGFNPMDMSTDQGGQEQDVLKYWMSKGMPIAGGLRSKLLGFIEIDPRNDHDVRRAIAECGVVYFGAVIPASYASISPGDSWGVAQDAPEGGHCFLGVGYNPGSVICQSWGFNIPWSNIARAKYCDEAYALVSQDWVERTGMTPFNMTLNALQDTLSTIKVSR